MKNFNIYQDRILDTVGMGILFGYIFGKRAFCLLAPPKQIRC